MGRGRFSSAKRALKGASRRRRLFVFLTELQARRFGYYRSLKL